MPRTGGVYSPPAGTKGVSNTTIQSVPYNAFVDDLTDDANAARPVTAGGTGATTASGARTALGLAIGTNVQAYDAGLQSIAGLTTSADKMIYTTAADAYATTALTPFARTLLDDATAAAALTTLGVSTFMQTVLDDADAATARATLGANNASNLTTGTVPDARLSGSYTGLTLVQSTDLRVSGGAFQAGWGTNFDELWHDDGTNTWYLTTDAPSSRYTGDTSSTLKLGTLSLVNALAVAEGGTGATTAAGAQSNLGVPPNGRTITAGNGLTGGGDLSANRTLTLGTPSNITNSTTNSVTSTSHTHALGFTAAEVYTGSTATNTSFPLGHSVIVADASAANLNNGAYTVRLHATESDNAYALTGAGSALSGTWRMRGRSGNTGMAQRTA